MQNSQSDSYSLYYKSNVIATAVYYNQGRQEDVGGQGQIKNVRPLQKWYSLVTLVCKACCILWGYGGCLQEIRLSDHETEFESDMPIWVQQVYWWLLSIRRSRAWIYIVAKLSAKYIIHPQSSSLDLPLASISICYCFTFHLTIGT